MARGQRRQRRKRRSRAAGMLTEPRTAERQYTNALRRFWGEAQAIVIKGLLPLMEAWHEQDKLTHADADDDADILRELRRWIARAAQVGGEPPPQVPPGMVTVETIERQIAWIKLQLGQRIRSEELQGLIDRAYETTDGHVAREMNRLFRIDPRKANPALAAAVDVFRERNIELIESGLLASKASPQLRPSLLADVSALVEESHASGLRVEQLAKALSERFGVSDSRAALIARDQVLKLNANITKARQRAVGIEQYRWVTSRDERVRPGHAALDNSIQRWDTPPVTDPRTGARNHPGEDYQCFPGSEPVLFVPGIRKLFRARFSGEAPFFVMETGETLHATPNHPILTRDGWEPASELQVGDEVISASRQGFKGLGPYADDPVTFEQMYQFFADVCRSEAVRDAKLHGDLSPDDPVGVIDINWSLVLERYPRIGHPFAKLALTNADPAPAGLGDSKPMIESLGPTTDRFIGFSRQLLSLIRRSLRHPEKHRLGAGSLSHSVIFQDTRDNGSAYPKTLGDSLDAAAGFMSAEYRPVKIIDAVMRPLSAPVYTLETHAGWYHTACVVANCRCIANPILPVDID